MMPGLIEDQMGQQQAPGIDQGAQGVQGRGVQQPGRPPSEQTPEQQMRIGEPKKANPDKQRLYDMYVGNAFNIIHGEQSRDTIIKMLKRGKPVDAVADTTLMVMKKLDATAQAQGVNVSDDVRLHGGNEIMGELIMVGEASGAFKQMKPEEREAAFRIAVGKYLQAGYRSRKYKPRDIIDAADKMAGSLPNMNLEQDAQDLYGYINPKKIALPTPGQAPAGGGAPPAGGATPPGQAQPAEGAQPPQTPLPEERLRR